MPTAITPHHQAGPCGPRARPAQGQAPTPRKTSAEYPVRHAPTHSTQQQRRLRGMGTQAWEPKGLITRSNSIVGRGLVVSIASRRAAALRALNASALCADPTGSISRLRLARAIDFAQVVGMVRIPALFLTDRFKVADALGVAEERVDRCLTWTRSAHSWDSGWRSTRCHVRSPCGRPFPRPRSARSAGLMCWHDWKIKRFRPRTPRSVSELISRDEDPRVHVSSCSLLRQARYEGRSRREPGLGLFRRRYAAAAARSLHWSQQYLRVRARLRSM